MRDFALCETRDEFVLPRTIEAGVGDEMQPGRFAESREQPRIAAEKGRRSLED